MTTCGYSLNNLTPKYPKGFTISEDLLYNVSLASKRHSVLLQKCWQCYWNSYWCASDRNSSKNFLNVILCLTMANMWHACSLHFLVIIYLTTTRWNHFHVEEHMLRSPKDRVATFLEGSFKMKRECIQLSTTEWHSLCTEMSWVW